ncbi:MAG: threonylcarbamoyl-AMP synthase [Bacteroidetes bacterium]|nr:threonylcarbamoyl-AMP synthase [Bacteroidota bacterium]
MPNKPNLEKEGTAPSIGTDLGLAARYLRQGLPVGMPTETVYGMAANALDAEAVARVFKAKKRPDFDPLIVHVGQKSPLQDWVREIPSEAQALMSAFWPGPLTLLLPKTERIPGLVTSGLDRVGLRMPRHPLALALLDMLDFPLAAPSANLFGYISPTKALHVREAFGPELPYVLDGGDCEIGLESTIVGFENGKACVYRRGGIESCALARVLGYLPEERIRSEEHPAAPGMLSRHYAPRTPLSILKADQPWPEPDSNVAVILPLAEVHPAHVKVWVLSENKDPYEAARKWYACLREADQAGFSQIFVRMLPEHLPFADALNDKFMRAADSADHWA